MSSVLLIWIWLCAWLNGAGWALSALHELNLPGYAAALLLGLAGLGIAAKFTGPGLLPPWRRPPWRRFRRPLPLAFLVLAGLAGLGGALYSPNNYDGLTYRVPRILHWLAAGQWHWIHTFFPRLNARACGVEWLSTPLILLGGTDRLLFLLNGVSLLLLPGLVFSVFTRLGVSRRVAWHWMWLAPTGYGFLLQAGSLGNDLFGAPFVLAALDFALRFRTTQSPRDLLTSVLAAALLTSAKTSNLPMLLPWALALLPMWRLAGRWPVRLAATGVLAAFASFLPTAALNWHYCHDWSGLKSEYGCERHEPAVRLGANLVLLAEQNLTPPVCPWAKQWNQLVKDQLPPSWSRRLHQNLNEPEAADFRMEPMQIEENTGMGFGITLLLLASLAAAFWREGWAAFRWQFDSGPAAWLTVLRWAPVVSLLVLLAQSTVFPIARILGPYYALLLPAFLAGAAQGRLVRCRWWRLLAGTGLLLAFLLLVVNPARPLFPAATLFSSLPARLADNPLAQQAARTYEVYARRNDAFAPVLSRLPPGLKVLGLVTYDDPETSLWRPFGSRRVEHICPEDTAEDLHRRGIEYALIPCRKLEDMFHYPAADWVRRVGGTVIDVIPLDIRVSNGPQDWWLVRLAAAPTPVAP